MDPSYRLSPWDPYRADPFDRFDPVCLLNRLDPWGLYRADPFDRFVPVCLLNLWDL